MLSHGIELVIGCSCDCAKGADGEEKLETDCWMYCNCAESEVLAGILGTRTVDGQGVDAYEAVYQARLHRYLWTC